MEEQPLLLVGRDDSHESLIQVPSFLPHQPMGPDRAGAGCRVALCRVILAQTLRRVSMQLLESIRDGSSNPARDHGAVPRVHGEYRGRLRATV
jgi:hypothetical protein